MSLTSPAVLSTHHLLHPWDEADTSAPRTLVFTAQGDKISIAAATEEEGDGGERTHGEEIALEIDKAKLRTLMYHPGFDTPLVLEWDEDGITVYAHDAVQEGMRVTLDRDR